MKDKKTKDGALTFILVNGIGAAEVVKNVPHDDVISFLEQAS